MRVPELVGGVFIVAASVLGILVWQQSSAATTPMLVVGRDVVRGSVLTEADFALADVRATGMKLVTFAERDQMVGRIAAVDLVALTPLNDTIAVEVLPIGADQALVGRQLELGQFPTGISAGSAVRVVMPIASATGDAPAITPVSITATVEDVRVGESGADTIEVTLRVADAVADQVAAAGEVRLVQVEG